MGVCAFGGIGIHSPALKCILYDKKHEKSHIPSNKYQDID
jgi:hypothetical protein